MSVNVAAPVNTAIDTFQTWIDKHNQLSNAFFTVTVTANGDANGSLTTGNAWVNGTFGATVLATPTLRGGNVQAAANLSVTSNVVVGNSTVNTHLGYGTIQLSGNMSLNSTTWSVGNSTVNASINSTSLSIAYATFSSNVSVGSNVKFSTSGWSVGNSTVNSVANSTMVTFSGINVATVANRTAVSAEGVPLTNTSRVNFIAGQNIQLEVSYDSSGAQINVTINAAALEVSVGGDNTQVLINDSGEINATAGFTYNKTTNTVHLGNSTVNTVLTPVSVSVGGGSTLNSTSINVASGFIANSSQASGNAIANTQHFHSGNTGKLLTTDVVRDAAAFKTITFATTMSANCANGTNFKTTMTANATIGFTSVIEGKGGMLKIIMDSTGSRVLDFDSTCLFADGVKINVAVGASKSSILGYIGANATHVVITRISSNVALNN